MLQQVEFNVDVSNYSWAKPVSITINDLVQLGASGGLGCFTPTGTFPVSDLVAGDLPILVTKGWGVPPKHDALKEDKKVD